MRSLEHFMRIACTVRLAPVDESHVDHGVGVRRVLLERLPTEFKSSLKVFALVVHLLQTQAVETETDVTPVVETAVWLQLSSLFIMDDAFLEILSNEIDAGDKFVKNGVALEVFESRFKQVLGL